MGDVVKLLLVTFVLFGPRKAADDKAKPQTAKRLPTTGKPATAKPATATPTTAKPATTKPPTAKPATTKPPTAKPPTAKPPTAKPPTTQEKDAAKEKAGDEGGPQNAIAKETGTSQNRMSSQAKLKMGGGSFSFSSGVNGMALKSSSKDGVSFQGSEESESDSTEQKMADIASGQKSLSSVKEKVTQKSEKKAIDFTTQGATNAMFATADERQGLSVTAEKGVDMKNSVTQTGSVRESEETAQKDGNNEMRVKKYTEDRLDSQVDNTMKTEGQTKLNMLTDGKTNSMKVEAEKSSEGSTSMVGKNMRMGTLEGMMTDGKTQKTTKQSYEKGSEIAAQANFEALGNSKLETNLDFVNGLGIGGQAEGGVTLNQVVDLKKNDSSKGNNDSSKDNNTA